MTDLIEKISKNIHINSMIDSFKSEFEENFKKANDEEKEILIKYRDEIFRKWLFSPFVPGSCATPSFIINNLARNYEKGQYTIWPHIKIIIKNNKVDFETDWLVYTCDNNPIVFDLQVLIGACKPHIRNNDEELIEQLVFQSLYYLDFILTIGERLGVFKQVKAVGCKCYEWGEKVGDFVNQDKSERAAIIMKESLQIAHANIQQELGISHGNLPYEMFDNSVDFDVFGKYVENRARKYSMSGSDMRAFYEVGIAVDRNFTVVFGYYLGLISPVYYQRFFVEVFLKRMANCVIDEEIKSLLFLLEVGHDLTAVGNHMVCHIKDKLREKSHGNVIQYDLVSAVEYYIDNKEDILYRELGAFFS